MKKHSRLYVQILSYFLVLSLLIGVVTAVTYFSFVRQQKLDFQRQMRGNMRSVHNEYSQIIYNICGIHQMFFEMPFVRESYVRLDEQTLEDKLATKEIIATLRNGLNALGNNIVVDIFTYNDDQRVYSIQGTSDSRHFFTHMNRFEDSGHEAWMELLNERAGMRILDVMEVNQNQSVTKRVLPVANLSYCNGNLCAFVTLCSVNALAQKYEQTAVFEDSKYILLDRGGNVIYDRSGLADSLPADFAKDGSSCRIGGVRYDVIVEEYGPFGWKAVCLTPSTVVLRLGEFYIVIASALCLGLLLLSIALAWVFSRRIYHPISGLHQEVESALGEAFLASGNELHDLSRNVQAVMEYSNSVQDVQHIHAQRYAKARILEIIEGHFISDEQSLLETLRTEFGFEHRCLGCALYEDDRKIGEMPSGIRTMWIAHRSGVVICVYNQETQTPDAALYGHGMRAGVGDAYDGVYGLCASFETAVNQYVARPIEPVECVFRPSAFAPLLRHRDVGAACEMVDALADQLNGVWPGYREAREWVNRVYDACIQTLGMELYRYCDALRTEANKYLDIFLSRDGIDAQPLKTFVRMTIDLIPEANVAHGNYDLAQRIRTCIDTCYFEELSLAILADKMGVSDKYVSRVFKEEFQLNVSDYIALVRIEHAKQLMRNGIAINVAARQVGIESRATFIRVFRKLEGMTPSEYVSRSH